MTKPNDKIKVIDCKASDNEYLHKDFHGALCYAIKYLDETYGPDATTEYLQQVARSYFSPLIAEVKTKGLSALEEHFRRIFKLEQGDVDFIHNADGSLTLNVKRCPAIDHLKKRNIFYTDRFCQTTVVVNDTICRDAGCQCSCTYQPGQGVCTQTFWKNK